MAKSLHLKGFIVNEINHGYTLSELEKKTQMFRYFAFHFCRIKKRSECSGKVTRIEKKERRQNGLQQIGRFAEERRKGH